jgi:hypothetical protein
MPKACELGTGARSCSGVTASRSAIHERIHRFGSVRDSIKALDHLPCALASIEDKRSSKAPEDNRRENAASRDYFRCQTDE